VIHLEALIQHSRFAAAFAGCEWDGEMQSTRLATAFTKACGQCKRRRMEKKIHVVVVLSSREVVWLGEDRETVCMCMGVCMSVLA
jgi:hypothetical protein